MRNVHDVTESGASLTAGSVVRPMRGPTWPTAAASPPNMPVSPGERSASPAPWGSRRLLVRAAPSGRETCSAASSTRTTGYEAWRGEVGPPNATPTSPHRAIGTTGVWVERVTPWCRGRDVPERPVDHAHRCSLADTRLALRPGLGSSHRGGGSPSDVFPSFAGASLIESMSGSLHLIRLSPTAAGQAARGKTPWKARLVVPDAQGFAA